MMAVELTAESQDRLTRATNIWFATVRPDGRPHLVPVWFVWSAGRIYCCFEPLSIKSTNITGNPAVALALEDGSQPIICEGIASILNTPWPDEVVKLYFEKYQWDIRDEAQYTQLVEVNPVKWLTW